MIELSEDGYIEVAIAVGDQRVAQRLDLYAVNNHLFELGRTFQGKSVSEYTTAVVEYLTTLGYPACSHRTAQNFEKEIVRIVEDFRKKDAASEKPVAPKLLEPASSGQQSDQLTA